MASTYPNPESSIARPLLALATSSHPPSSSHTSRRHRVRTPRLLFLTAAGALLVVLLGGYVYFGPSAGLPVPAPLRYGHGESGGGGGGGGWGGNAPPPPHGHGHDGHPHGAPPPLHGSTPIDDPDWFEADADAGVDALLAAQPRTIEGARARYSLQTGRTPPEGFDAFFEFARDHHCLTSPSAYPAIHRDFAPFWRVERAVAALRQKEGDPSGGR
ncbi:hypothetical protein DFH06DRAFT_1468703, partial [Mycena polygramma]